MNQMYAYASALYADDNVYVALPIGEKCWGVHGLVGDRTLGYTSYKVYKQSSWIKSKRILIKFMVFS